MVHQIERCEDWIHYNIGVIRDIQTHEIRNHQRPTEHQEKSTQDCAITYIGKGSEEEYIYVYV